MTGKGSKLIAIILVALVIASGLGYWLLAPMIPSQAVTSTIQQTSLSTTSQQTLVSSTFSTTLAPETTLWINVTATKSVTYYVSLLKSAGAQPYVELGWELQALPDATNATAIAKITYLALNATNPEVKEAFQLMIKGGTPAPGDFKYAVPNFNTELEVLYWLALQNEFKKDDTLALAIAMDHGIYVTMGTGEVRQAVLKDSNDLLRFFRETNERQKTNDEPQLEDYPLEAKVALAWRGSWTASPEGGPFSLSSNSNGCGGACVHQSTDFTSRKVELFHYNWNMVSLDTLRSLRALIEKNGWYRGSVTRTVNFLDGYFFNGVWGMPNGHWNFTDSWDSKITIDGVEVASRNFVNVNFQYRYFLEHGYGIGVCQEEATFVDALLKSYGIASLPDGWEKVTNGQVEGDGAVLYFDPPSSTWKGAELRSTKWNNNTGSTLTGYSVLKPPVIQPQFLRWHRNPEEANNLPVYVANSRHWEVITFQEMYNDLTGGIGTSIIKNWLLYEENHSA